MDIKKGDTIRYSYYVYGVQLIATGLVSKILEDGSCVIDKGENELIVNKSSILNRYPRENEILDNQKFPEKTNEEQFNEMHKGISLHKKSEKILKKDSEHLYLSKNKNEEDY